MPAAESDLPGGRLGKYEIRGVLGRGAMGTVYEGWDPIIARRVAIKTVRRAAADDAEATEQLARFRREAQAAGRLTHPNIVGIFDTGETDELAYIVMEFVEGRTIRALLEKGERLALPEVRRVMQDLLAGLQYSHAHGVVHRDIKPANLILTSGGQTKIADFGVARIESSSLTQAGTVIGTPAYMSPEQFTGRPADARSDIYSAGVVLYQLLTGERPFDGSVTAIMHKVLNTEPPKASDLSVSAPPALDAVIAGAMAKRPDERFASAATFAEAIEAALTAPPAAAEVPERADATIVTPPAGPPPAAPLAVAPAPGPTSERRQRKPLTLVASVAAALLVVAGGAWWALAPSPAPPAQPPKTPEAALTPSSPPPVASAPPPSSAAAMPAAPAPPPATVEAPPSSPPATPAGVPKAAEPPSPPPKTAETPAPPKTAETPPPAPPPKVAESPASPSPPKATESPPPAAPRQQQAVVPLVPEALRKGVAAALAAAPCTAAGGTLAPSPQVIAIDGLIGGGQPEAALHQVLTNAAPGVVVDWRLSAIDPAFCGVLDALRPIRAAFGATGAVLAATLAGTERRTWLVKGDPIAFIVTMPDFPTLLAIDDFSRDGSVYHLRQMPMDGGRPYAPRSLGKFDRGEDNNLWTVDAPYGTDLVLFVAASAPLFAAPRPANDSAAAYLSALQAAIEEARNRGARAAGTALVLETREK
jgi:serine/threonine-protein kinase